MDDIGINRDLAVIGRKLFSSTLRRSVQRHFERKLAEKSGDAALAGRRVSLEPARAFMSSFARLVVPLPSARRVVGMEAGTPA